VSVSPPKAAPSTAPRPPSIREPDPRRPVAQRLARVSHSIAVAPIVLYRTVVSPAIPRRCKYEPTCSLYALEAIRQYGILRGLVLAGWRLLRCNPWSHGGYDPVEAQRVFSIGPRPTVKRRRAGGR
jgi:putative membrane protein insertion efficiency factor